MLKKMNKKGFTLAELLIVVAIIAVLVAISIPIFTTQLEKSREATDEANIRSLYVECSAAVLTEDTSAKTTAKDCALQVVKDAGTGVVTGTATIKLSQLNDGLQSGATSINIGGVDIPAAKFVHGKYIKIVIKNDGTATDIDTADAAGTNGPTT